MEGNRYILTRTPVMYGSLYQVIDTRTGTVLRQRRSSRPYVAAEVFGSRFFGRRGLVLTGGRQSEVNRAMRERDAARSDEERRQWQERIDRLNTIAYLEE